MLCCYDTISCPLGDENIDLMKHFGESLSLFGAAVQELQSRWNRQNWEAWTYHQPFLFHLVSSICNYLLVLLLNHYKVVTGLMMLESGDQALETVDQTLPSSGFLKGWGGLHFYCVSWTCLLVLEGLARWMKVCEMVSYNLIISIHSISLKASEFHWALQVKSVKTMTQWMPLNGVKFSIETCVCRVTPTSTFSTENSLLAREGWSEDSLGISIAYLKNIQ